MEACPKTINEYKTFTLNVQYDTFIYCIKFKLKQMRENDFQWYLSEFATVDIDLQRLIKRK